MGLKKLYHKFKRIRQMKQIAAYTDLCPDSYFVSGFLVDLRFPQKEHIYLKTGKHSVIDGQFVFETSGGYIQLGDRVHIGNSTLISANQIIIEDDVTIAWSCLIYDHNSHSVNWEERKHDTEQEYRDIKAGLNPITNKDWSVVRSAPIRICRKAWIGTGVKILKGVTIGEGAVVAAGSVVVKDVAPWTVVGGNPACVIKVLQEQDDE